MGYCWEQFHGQFNYNCPGDPTWCWLRWDPYEAGTLRERAYLRSLHPNKLAEQINEDELDNKDNEIHENSEKDFVDIDEVINKGNSQGPSTTPRPSSLPVGHQFELPFSPPKKRQIAGINESQLTDRDAEGETDWEFD